MIQGVGEDDVAIVVEGHSCRAIELSFAATLLTPTCLLLAVFVEDEDLVVRLVGDIQQFVIIAEQAGRPLECACADGAEIVVGPVDAPNFVAESASTEDIHALIFAEGDVNCVGSNPAHAESHVIREA